MIRILVALLILLSTNIRLIAQTELVINGGYETWPGAEWVRVNPADGWVPDAQRTPHSGSYHFYPQNTVAASSELYQDIDLSSYTAAIDAGTANFTFSGWRRGYRNSVPFSADNDRSQMIVEYRDASNAILASFDTGSAVFNTWTQSTETRNAPVGTRSVRIRLISVRVTGSDNDGYYDDISFIYNNPPTSCTPPTTLTLNPSVSTSYCEGSTINIFIQSITPFSPNYYYTWYKNGTALAPASLSYVPLSYANVTIADAGTYTLRVEYGNAGLATCYKEASVTVLVHPPVVAGTISNNQEICLGASSAPLTGTASTGGIVTKYYKWEKASAVVGPWTSVQAYTLGATGYTPGALTTSTYYRRTDSSGVCSPQVTDTVFIRVNNKAVLNNITSILRDTLCAGENFQLTASVNTATNPSINGGYYYTWIKKQGATSTVLSGPSNVLTPYPTTSRPAVVTDSGHYFLVVQDGLSATLCKDTLKKLIVTHNAPLQKAIVQSHQQACLNATFNPITELQASSGSNGSPLFHQWYINTDSTNALSATKINGATSINYTPGIATNTRYYVRKDSIKYCPSVASNYVELRTNNTPKMDSIYSMSGDTLCVNLSDPFQLKGYLDSTTTGKASINGGYKFTWYKLQQPATVPVIVSSTSSYMDYPATSRNVAESDSGTYFLVVQDGFNATTCMDTLKYKVTVYNNCVAITCAKPIDVSIKVGSSSNDTLCTGNAFVLQKDVINFPATPPTNGYSYSWIKTTTSGTVVVMPPSTTYQDLILPSVVEADSGGYQLFVQDGLTYPNLCGTLSPSIKLTVYKPVLSGTIGNDTTVCNGATMNALHTVINTSGGNGTYSYQWQESTDNVTFTSISGETFISFTPAPSDTTYYRRAEFSHTCEVKYSNVVQINIIDKIEPKVSIESYPSGNICDTLQQITYTATPIQGQGSNPSYQWYNGNTNSLIVGATNSNYTPSTTPANGDQYYVVMNSNALCVSSTTVTSSTFTLTLLTTPQPLLINNDTNICSLNSVVLSANNLQNGTSLQWYKNGILIPGATQASYTVTSNDLPGGVYTIEVTNQACSARSTNVVNIQILQSPSVDAGTDIYSLRNKPVTLQGSVNNASFFIWTPSSGLSDPSLLNPLATVLFTTTYQLLARDASGLCKDSSSVTIYVKDAVIIPNSFTPNNDQLNDRWRVEGIEQYPKATIQVYNRWGTLIWSNARGESEWDGTTTHNSALLPDGTYFYVIELNELNEPVPYKGYIQLIR